MFFNSIAFLLFFSLFFLVYWFVNKRAGRRSVNLLLIAGSYFFYGWWDWRFLNLIIISSLADYLLGLLIFQSTVPRQRKILLGLSILINLGILGFFKYFNFFVESLEHILAFFSLQIQTRTLHILLPVGISFYTFQTMSYSIDIYREKMEPTRDPAAFFAFVAFFPQLVAGPIERAANLLPQFSRKAVFDYPRTVEGLRLILWGFFQKIVIADNFGLWADQLLDPASLQQGPGVLLGLLLFSFQIYCDFSGYSSIAIGLGKTLGFDLTTNFRNPYFSASLTEFWHRWHITLSTWFRDYVYIPLGGNRGTALRVNVHLFITFLLSGLWHGARITFLIWGALHGLALILEKALNFRPKTAWSSLIIFPLVTLFWMPFRAEDTTHLQQLWLGLNTWKSAAIAIPGFFSGQKWVGLLFAFLLFLTLEFHMGKENFHRLVVYWKSPWRWGMYYILFLAILLLGNYNLKPYFIYFQF